VPTAIEGNQLLLLHTEAVFFLRKIILETAQKLWPEVLLGVQASSILHHTQVRSKLLEHNFESELISNCGFNTGMEYTTETQPESCQNFNIMYRTFLTEQQARDLSLDSFR
jgi:hypothetical protein